MFRISTQILCTEVSKTKEHPSSEMLLLELFIELKDPDQEQMNILNTKIKSSSSMFPQKYFCQSKKS